MTNVMMLVGDNAFAIDSTAYDSYHLSEAARRWPSQQRITRLPARQLIGADSQPITLSGFILSHFNKRGLKPLAHHRRKAAAAGQDFVDGDWVVLSLEQTRTVLFANGSPRRVDCTITLKLWG